VRERKHIIILLTEKVVIRGSKNNRKVNKTKSFLFSKKIGKVDQLLDRLRKRKNSKSDMKRGDIKNAATEIKRIIMNYYEQLCSTNWMT
jgi:hypothetical protein